MKHRFPKHSKLLLFVAALVGILIISLGPASHPDSVRRLPERREVIVTFRDSEVDTPAASEQRGKLQHANAANFGESVLNSDVPVLVFFYADWSDPCQSVAPVLEDLARETRSTKIVKVNIDENAELVARYKIASIPSLKLFKDGEVVEEHAGLASKN
jgi:thioredoxin 1